MATTRQKAKASAAELPPAVVPGAVQGLLNRRQVCAALGGMTVRKLNQMIAAGMFPRPDFQLGGVKMMRWSVALVNRWVDEAAEKNLFPVER